jgi:hypothetical protein
LKVILEFLRPQQRGEQVSDQKNGKHNDDYGRDVHGKLPQLLAALDIPEGEREKENCE